MIQHKKLQISFRKKLIFTLIMVSGVFIISELSLRCLMHFNNKGLSFDDHNLFLHKPKTLVWNKFVANNKGFFGDDLIEPKPMISYRIFLMGGSTSASPVYPKIVKETLQEKFPERIIEVNSVATARYTSSHNLRLLKYYLLDLKPDCLVVYLGINDNIYNTFPWAEDAPNAGVFDYLDCSCSVIIDMFSYYMISKPFRSKPDFEKGPVRSKAFFECNLREIIEISRENKIDVILLKFALSYPTDDHALLSKIRYKEKKMKHMWGLLDSTLRGVMIHRQIMEKLSIEYRLPIGDLDTILPKDSTVFTDICHKTPKGETLFASYIAGLIGESQIIKVDE